MFKSERIIIKKNDEDKPVKELERDEIEKFIKSLDNPEVIEIVYVKIKHAYVFKLPSHQSSSSGWKGADWRKQIWKGRLKIVERTNIAAIVLEDSTKNNIFAICPIRDGAVDRCIDSSRYFILRIENSLRRHIFIGLAFNERNDAFDFNTALEDISREKRCITIKKNISVDNKLFKEYNLKKAENFFISMPKIRSKSKKKNCNTRNSIFHRFSGTEKLHNPCVEELDSNNLLNNTKETIVPKVLESNRTSRSSCPQRVVSDIRLLRPSSRDTPRKVIGYFSHIHE